MTPILVSQRVIQSIDMGERRDVLDQRWANFLQQCGLLTIPIANNREVALQLRELFPQAGLLLTGGGDLECVGGEDPEREAVERALLQSAIEAKLPVFGVGRGMQMIGTFFGGKLSHTPGHITKQQMIEIRGIAQSVNSDHEWGFTQLPPELSPWAFSRRDNVIKALTHNFLPIVGVMWNPERLAPFADRDLAYFRNHFGVNRI